jgi:hypothetical protein
MRAITPSMLPSVFPRQGRRRPTQIFCAAGAGGVTTAKNMRQRRLEATAYDSNSPKELRREI